MAIKLSSKVNAYPPDAIYPYGNINDDTGTGNGTPVDKNTYADLHQFFAKMVADAGITLNDLPENSVNGFQYNDALNNLLNGNALWYNLSLTTSNFRGYKTSTSTYYNVSALSGTVRLHNNSITKKLTINIEIDFTSPSTTVDEFHLDSIYIGNLVPVSKGAVNVYNSSCNAFEFFRLLGANNRIIIKGYYSCVSNNNYHISASATLEIL